MGLRIDRRMFLASTGAVLATQPAPTTWAAGTGVTSVMGLRVDYLELPLAIDSEHPLLSWRIESPGRDVAQLSYRIRVAGSAARLAAGEADLWDSGVVPSAQSVGIRYDGPKLLSRQICHWQVEVVTSASPTPVRSASARWEMGLLRADDWTSRWLAAETLEARAEREAGLHWVTGPAAEAPRYFRKTFSLERDNHGKLTVVANGALVLWVDGEKIAFPALNEFAFGAAPALATPITLPAGEHTLLAQVATDTHSITKVKPAAEFAALLRLDADAGPASYITSEAMQTSLDAQAPDWDVAAPTRQQRQPWPAEPGMLLRHTFRAHGAVRRARLHVTALGACIPHLNGQRVGSAVLAPESTDFRKRTRYQTFDVTREIVAGANAIGLMVGDGWYASNVAPGGRYAMGPAPRRALAQLEIDYEDGRSERIGSGAGWKIAPSAVLKSEIYDGEDYDARLAQDGWSTPEFDASHWRDAEFAASPPCISSAQCSPPIRAKMTLAAKRISQPAPGVYVFDFGQNFAGWARLHARGDSGRTVELRFAELLLPDGTVDQSNLRAARARDVYTMRGDPAGETYEPHFTYHGFRYVQVEGYPGTPGVDDVLGIVVYSDLPETGHLAVGNALIQRLWKNTLWSQRSNFVGIPTDCPQRDERLGWMGDANVFWDAAAYNMDVAAFTRRFMQDVRDAQYADGAFADYAPAAEKLVWFEPGAAPGWADGGVTLPWTAWQRYGDTGIIEENWDAMQRYIRFIHARNPDYVWRHGRANDYGDWLALDARHPGDPTTPKELIGTATWAHSVSCLIEMARAIGREDDAQRYEAMRAALEHSFRTAFVAADGSVGNGSQTGYILALRYRLVPDALRAAAADRLVADIRRRGTLLSTGFLGTPGSLDVLCDVGHSRLAYDLLLRTEFPGWGYMIEKGATTIWERWNGDTGDVSMNSFNHYALGAICGFMFRRIAGIDATQPGFRAFRFKPEFDARVPRGGARYDSVMGTIRTRWERQADRFTLALTVPANVSAEVHLPAGHDARIIESGRDIGVRGDRTPLRREGDAAILGVGAGEYQFSVS